MMFVKKLFIYDTQLLRTDSIYVFGNCTVKLGNFNLCVLNMIVKMQNKGKNCLNKRKC